jgi:hypothetical protein
MTKTRWSAGRQIVRTDTALVPPVSQGQGFVEMGRDLSREVNRSPRGPLQQPGRPAQSGHSRGGGTSMTSSGGCSG